VSQGLSDATGGAGNHRDLSSNRVHIHSAIGLRLKATNFVWVEARLLDSFGDAVHD
jgi:hypothetical protein